MADNDSQGEQLLRDCKVAFVGKLGGMSRRDAQQLLRERGAVCCERLDARVEVVVVGEGQFPLGADDELATQLDAAADDVPAVPGYRDAESLPLSLRLAVYRCGGAFDHFLQIHLFGLGATAVFPG